MSQICDSKPDCLNAHDEQLCSEQWSLTSAARFEESPAPPSTVQLDPSFHLVFNASAHVPSRDFQCPDTHFQCSDHGYCLPIFLRCNDVHDCPDKEDEDPAECSRCPGLYRCLSSRLCLLDVHLCDGFAHCPQRDDEMLCGLTCPDHCTCHGLAHSCEARLPGDLPPHPHLRYLQLWGGGGDGVVETLRRHTLLIHLSVTGGRLTHFNVSLPNLNSLDLRHNRITCLGHVDFTAVPRLRVLQVGDNPLTSSVVPWSQLPLSVLDLANCRLTALSLHHLAAFPQLHTLNMSGCRTQRLTAAAPQALRQLAVLDLRGCPLTHFPPRVFAQLGKLQALYADSYRLCCPDLLPGGFSQHDCLAATDEVSDCDGLLKDGVHVVFTVTAAALAVTGNVAGLVVRCVQSRPRQSAFKAVLLHLSVSDGLMGLRLAILGAAHLLFRGHYHWHDPAWRRSEACGLCALLSVLSCQVSSGLVCLATLDMAGMRCGCMARRRLQPRSLHLLAALTWLTAVAVAIAAASHVPSQGSTHALCWPMLVWGRAGIRPVMGGHVLFTSLLHLLTAAGLVCVLCRPASDYHLPQSSPAAEAVMLTLTYTAVTRVAWWIMVSLPVTAAMADLNLPQAAPVHVCVLVLPLSAALQPLLSGLALVISRRRQAARARLMQILTARLAAKSA